MAKFISDPKVALLIKTDFAEQTFDRYNKFLNQLPMYVDYFSIDEVTSNFDRSLHGVETLLGDDSPLKFVKLVDFPLYQFNVSNAAASTSDVGSLESEVTGEAVVLSEHGTPKVDDLFVVTDISSKVKNIYRVNKSDLSKVNGVPVYQISFYLYTDEQVSATELSNQTVGEYKPVTDSDSDAVKFVPTTKAATINELKILSDKLKSEYSEMFFDKMTGMVSFRQNNGSFIYDPVGIHYMRTVNVFKHHQFYRNEMHFPPKRVPFSLESSKKDNIWNAIIKADKNAVSENNFLTLLPIEVTRDSTYFGYQVSVLVPIYVSSLSTMETKYPIYGNFKEYLLSNDEQFVPDVIPVEYASLFKQHINRNLNETSLLEVMRRIEIEYEFLDFFMIPVLIYVTDQKVQELITNS